MIKVTYYPRSLNLDLDDFNAFSIYNLEDSDRGLNNDAPLVHGIALKVALTFILFIFHYLPDLDNDGWGNFNQSTVNANQCGYIYKSWFTCEMGGLTLKSKECQSSLIYILACFFITKPFIFCKSL